MRLLHRLESCRYDETPLDDEGCCSWCDSIQWCGCWWCELVMRLTYWGRRILRRERL